MKIVAKRKPLADAFATAATFASRNNVKPILQNVKIEASGDVMLLATDLEIGCRIGCTEVEVKKPGSAMLPIDRIGGLLKESTDDEIEIDATKDHVIAKTDRGEFNMPSELVGDFPDVAKFDHDAPHLEVASEAFRAGLSLVAFATDDESSRMALGCVKLDYEDSTLFMLATDGRRMARFQVPCSNAGDHDTSVNVVIRDSQMLRLARSVAGDGNLKIHIRENDCLFSCGGNEFYARLTAGAFPLWRDLPWKTNGDLFTAHCGPILTGIRQAALMLGKAKDSGRGLDFKLSDGTMRISANVADRGKSDVEVPVQYSGKPVTATLDSLYLSQWLTAVGPEATLEIDPSNGKERILLRAFEGTAQYVLMPMGK